MPQNVIGLEGVTEAYFGAGTFCAITESGQIKCWGNNDSGQLGDGTMNDSNVPVDVVGF